MFKNKKGKKGEKYDKNNDMCLKSKIQFTHFYRVKFPSVDKWDHNQVMLIISLNSEVCTPFVGTELC